MTRFPHASSASLRTRSSAQIFDAPISHLEITTRPDVYNPVLLEALASVRKAERVAA